MTGGIKIDTRQFRAAMEEYVKLNKRYIPTIVNTKAFYIARGAARNTKKTAKEQIMADLKKNFAGEHVKKKTVTRYNHLGATSQVSLLALIINSKRGKAGKPGLSGPKMTAAMNSFVARAYRSVAFIAAGFIPAIKELTPYAENKTRAPAEDKAIKQYGKPKGSGVHARAEDWFATAIITNFANADGDKKGALEKYAGTGLRRAFAAEMASMKRYMEEKMQAAANKVSTKKR